HRAHLTENGSQSQSFDRRVCCHPARVLLARVSKLDDQDTRMQVQALKRGGCTRIFEEKASGGRWDRSELHRAIEQLRKGDVLVVWKLDRLSRSLKDLLHILERIAQVDAGFRSLTE